MSSSVSCSRISSGSSSSGGGGSRISSDSSSSGGPQEDDMPGLTANDISDGAAVAAAAAPSAAATSAAVDAATDTTPPLPLPGIDHVASLIAAGAVRRIVCMCGAGVSVAAGIPDFRTPGTGLFSQLQKYELSKPEDIFDIDFFRINPKPFHTLANKLFPGRFEPTRAHHFIKLLHDKGLLLRCYTQNIDSLETQAGLPAEALVAAHGNFDGARCIRCNLAHAPALFRAAAASGSICRCSDESCGGLIKPDITFYGEELPARFYDLCHDDITKCDLLIVMGTSLAVFPFASLVRHVRPGVPRLLINREQVGGIDPLSRMGDALFLGDCDDGVAALAEALGWRAELEARCGRGCGADVRSG